MYYETESGRKLAGFMFLVRTPTERGPQIAGNETLWHYHVSRRFACFFRGLVMSGYPDENGACLAAENGGIRGSPPAFWRQGLPDAPPGCHPQPQCAEDAVSSQRTPEMMHVWLLDHPQGPFATKMRLEPDLLEILLQRRSEDRGF